MTTILHETWIRLRVICVNPLPLTVDGQAAIFGLQDRENGVHPGLPHADGALAFTCALEAERAPTMDGPRWIGLYAHGTPSARFLYLSWRYRDGDPRQWLRRIKVPLGDITWPLVEAVARGGVLQTTVDGRKAGMAQLIGGWLVTAGE